jgi:hypothetical protein
MLAPILSRAFDPLVASWMDLLFPTLLDRIGDPGFLLYYFGVWIALFLSLALYDRKVLHRVHRVTAAGFAWFVLVWVISLAT